MTPPSWLTKTVALMIAIAAAVLILLGLFAWHEWQASRTAHTETKLSTGQASASLQSGQDAVATAGTVEANSSAGDALTKENGDDIRNAQGASAAVAAPVRDAGLASLCRRASYRSDPKCMQHAPAK